MNVTIPPPEVHRIDWIRATFVGAIAGGVVWAIVFKVVSALDPHWPMPLRVSCGVAAVCLPLALAGVLLYRGAKDPRRRTYAVAAIIAPATGLALPLASLAARALGLVIGR